MPVCSEPEAVEPRRAAAPGEPRTGSGCALLRATAEGPLSLTLCAAAAQSSGPGSLSRAAALQAMLTGSEPLDDHHTTPTLQERGSRVGVSGGIGLERHLF